MSNILYLVPGVGLDEQEKKRREGLANTFLTHSANRVVVDDVTEGPTSIESSVEEYMSVPGTLRKIVQVQKDFDAIVLGCAGDPGLAPARELAEIPVIGPVESSIAAALMLGDRFSIVTVLDTIVPAIRHLLRSYGMADRCASVRVVDCPVLDLAGNRDTVLEALVEQGRAAVEQDGASSLILGCMSMAFLLMDEPAGEQLDIPVVNPAKVAIKSAEMLVTLGLSHSRRTYPTPDMDKLRQSIFKREGV